MLGRLVISLLILIYSNLSGAACGLLCTCSVVAGGAVNFGSAFSPIKKGNTDTVGSLTILCSAVLGGIAADYSIALSPGNSNSYTSRTMLKGTTTLAYNLYTTTARNIIWGDGTAGTSVVIGSLPILILGGTYQTINIYGRIRGPQPLVTPGGTYSDSINITVTY